MVIIWNFPKSFAGITGWPFIFIKPYYANDKGILAHEMVHYKEQRKAWVFPWIWKYVFNKQFRLEAEVRAYRVQIDMQSISEVGAVDLLFNRYKLGMSREYITDKIVASRNI